MVFFPASGIVRDVSLSLVAAAIFLSGEFLVMLLYQWVKSPRQLDDIRFTWSILTLSTIILLASYIVSDFYVPSWEREFWIKVGYISILSGITMFAFTAERKLLRTRWFFTSIGPVGIALTLLLPHTFLKYASYFFLFPTYSVFFILVFRHLHKRAEHPLRKQVKFFVAGFIFFLGGTLLAADEPVLLSGGLSYIVGSIMMIGGISTVNFVVLRMPSLGELDWRSKIKELYLISHTGVPLLYIDFESGISAVGPDQALTAAVISALSLGLKSVGKDGRVKVVDQGGLKFLFGYAENITLALAVTENLTIIRQKIDEFLKEFSILYGEILKTWDGNISVFKPAVALAMNIFAEGSKKTGER
ncbi:MAG: hypothetical protein KIH01_06860 [Candidatus Freyarchaeota archaeon]|nr:hypothetical protein [Candidatus Jordarchaeia archaeon]